MGSAFHQLCPRYSGTLTTTAPTANRLWETFYLYLNVCHSLTVSNSQVYSNDEFDLWPVYSGERFRALRPACLGFNDPSKQSVSGRLQE